MTQGNQHQGQDPYAYDPNATPTHVPPAAASRPTWKTVLGVILCVLAGLSLLTLVSSIGAIVEAMETDDGPRAVGAVFGQLFWIAVLGLVGYLLLRRPKPQSQSPRPQ